MKYQFPIFLVNYPRIFTTDFAWPNIHAILEVCNKTDIAKYIDRSFTAFMKGEEPPFQTSVTVCHLHQLPFFLKVTSINHNDNDGDLIITIFQTARSSLPGKKALADLIVGK